MDAYPHHMGQRPVPPPQSNLLVMDPILAVEFRPLLTEHEQHRKHQQRKLIWSMAPDAAWSNHSVYLCHLLLITYFPIIGPLLVLWFPPRICAPKRRTSMFSLVTSKHKPQISSLDILNISSQNIAPVFWWNSSSVCIKHRAAFLAVGIFPKRAESKLRPAIIDEQSWRALNPTRF